MAKDKRSEEGAEEPAETLWVERVFPDLLRGVIERSVEAGMATLKASDETVRGIVGDARIPREIAQALYKQIDETKSGLMRAVAKEYRDFLEATDIAHEIEKALTSLSFEVRTEIRFVPNDKRSGGVRPDVTMGKMTLRRDGKVVEDAFDDANAAEAVREPTAEDDSGAST